MNHVSVIVEFPPETIVNSVWANASGPRRGPGAGDVVSSTGAATPTWPEGANGLDGWQARHVRNAMASGRRNGASRSLANPENHILHAAVFPAIYRNKRRHAAPAGRRWRRPIN